MSRSATEPFAIVRQQLHETVRQEPHLAFLLDVYAAGHHARVQSVQRRSSARRRHHSGPAAAQGFSVRRPLRVGTDCAGMDAPLVALRLLRAPFTHVFSSEIDPHARATVLANHAPQQMYTDIMERDHSALPDIDLYVCGFPCQSFSAINSAGAKGFHQESRKGLIFFHCLEVIRRKRPAFFVLENVKTIESHDGGRTFAVIRQALRTLSDDYDVGSRVLNAKDYDGHIQNRPRVYIVGVRRRYLARGRSVDGACYPPPGRQRVPLDAVWDVGGEHPPAPLTPHKQRLLQQLRDRGLDIDNTNYVVNLNKSGSEGFPVHAMRDKCPCLLAHAAPFYLTSKRRNMSAAEALRIQGFPGDFQRVVSDRQLLQQCGNSMSIGVLCHLFKTVIASLVDFDGGEHASQDSAQTRRRPRPRTHTK